MRDVQRLMFVLVMPTLLSLLGGPESTALADSRDTAWRYRPASSTALKVARSTDGSTFVDTSEVFMRQAAAPDLEVLPNGDLLAVFDRASSLDPDEPTVMAVSRSRDGGRSWTPARPVRLSGRGAARIDARQGELVRVPGGSLRLYFLTDISSLSTTSRQRSRSMTQVRSAVTRNGLDYRLDGRSRIPLGRVPNAHFVAARIGADLHVYAAGWDDRIANDKIMSIARHFVSGENRFFTRVRSVRTANASFVGSIVSTENGLRAYITADGGIVSFVSGDDLAWEMEAEVGLSDGWDPAVVRLQDGSYFMLYCAPQDSEPSESVQLVDDSFDTAAYDDALWTIDWDAHEELADEAVNLDADATQVADVDSSGDTMSEGGAGRAVDTDHDAGEESDPAVADAAIAITDASEGGIGERVEEGSHIEGVDASADTADEGDTVDAESSSSEGGLSHEQDLAEQGGTGSADGPGQTGDGLENWDPIISDGFAPKPDFRSRIDYFEWYREYALGHPEDNAFWSYASFMPGTPGDSTGKPWWPELNDMFNGDYDGPPKPWKPDEHPEWEASYQAAQEVLERFDEASMHAGYASPPDLEVEGVDPPLGRGELLLGLLLPSLSPHRQMVKATLAAAWRLDDNGKVSSNRMLDAWKTSLRAANHVSSGATLIEELVGMAERYQVEETARWALKHDVFSGDELKTALEILRKLDRHERDPVEMLRGEHAMCMDLTQYLYMPPDADGTPRCYKPERLNDVFDFSPELLERLGSLGPDEVRTSIETFDTYYRELAEKMHIGYPEVRAADTRAATEKNRGATALTELLIPDLTRFYQLNTRSEASRRVTQLAYATHLFKDRNGRWPESLDELPTEHGERMRTDPFTGGNFGYKLTDDGPRIYSLSENGRNDDGVHSPHWDDKVESDTDSDDYVFWPPQPR